MALALDDELEALLQDMRSAAPARGKQPAGSTTAGAGAPAKKTKGPAGGDIRIGIGSNKLSLQGAGWVHTLRT
jgi:hypothetical protein